MGDPASTLTLNLSLTFSSVVLTVNGVKAWANEVKATAMLVSESTERFHRKQRRKSCNFKRHKQVRLT